MHRRADLWKDPDTFRPERFLEDGAKETGAVAPSPAPPTRDSSEEPSVHFLHYVASGLGRIGIEGGRTTASESMMSTAITGE